MKKKILEFIKKYAKWIIIFICFVLTMEMVIDVFGHEIMKRDIIGYGLISKYLIRDEITPIAKIITELSGVTVILILTLLCMIFIKNKKVAMTVPINLFIVVTLNVILKNIVQRPRPTELRLITETGYSFPSGHSMVSMAFYGYFIFLIYELVKSKKIKITLITIISILIPLIGTSRIYLGVHYTSDVMAGFLISIAYLLIYTSAVKKYVLDDVKSSEKDKDEEKEKGNLKNDE